MYRYNTATNTPTSTPTSRGANRRSTRTARGSAKRPRRNFGKKDAEASSAIKRIKQAAQQGPAKKWVQVMRPPATGIRFLVSKWMPYSELTEAERGEYEQRLLDDQKRREEEEASARKHQNELKSSEIEEPHQKPDANTSSDIVLESNRNEKTDVGPPDEDTRENESAAAAAADLKAMEIEPSASGKELAPEEKIVTVANQAEVNSVGLEDDATNKADEKVVADETNGNAGEKLHTASGESKKNQ